MQSPDEKAAGFRAGDPAYLPDDEIREGEPPLEMPQPSEPSIAIPRSLLDADRAFRSQIMALGVAWIALAAFSGFLVLFAVSRGAGAQPDDAPTRVILIAIGIHGVAWLAIGVFTCVRKMAAVYGGLALSYVIILGNLLSLAAVFSGGIAGESAPTSICCIMFFLFPIMQAHRVISFANRLHEAGIR